MTPRAAIAVTFAALCSCFGVWAGAAPAIMAQAGVSKQAWGLAIAAFTAAYVGSMFLGSRLSTRLSNRAVILTAIPIQTACTAAMLTAQNPAWLFVAMPLFGAFTGLIDVFMNAEAAAIEAEERRPLMSSFHAMASAGLAAAAVPASLAAAWYGMEAVAAGFALAMAAAWICVWTALRPHMAASRPPAAAAVRPYALFALLGMIAGLSITGETAAIVWSAKLLDEQAPALAAIAGAGACFYGAFHASVRFLGDTLRARAGDPQLVAIALAASAAGFATVGLSPASAVSLAGFALAGAGTALVVPCVFAMGAALEPHDRAGALGTLSLLTGAPRIAFPWIAGVVAERQSTGSAFLLCATLFLAGLAMAMALQRRAPRAA